MKTIESKEELDQLNQFRTELTQLLMKYDLIGNDSENFKIHSFNPRTKGIIDCNCPNGFVHRKIIVNGNLINECFNPITGEFHPCPG